MPRKIVSPIVLYRRHLAVNRQWSPHHLAAKTFTDGLMAKTYAENRRFARGRGYKVECKFPLP